MVCFDPTCHERNKGRVIEGAREKHLEEAGHAWQLGRFRDGRACSDGGAFGSHALSTGCWNRFAREGRGLLRGREVTVKGPRSW